MSHHAGSKWKHGDEITPQLIKAIASAMNANKEANKGKKYTPKSFSVIVDADKYVFFISRVLDIIGEEGWTESSLGALVELSKEVNGEIIRKVLEELGIEIKE